MPPKVLNKTRDHIPTDAVYIGRPSKWGNPYVIGVDGNREEVIQKYMEYLIKNKELFDSIEVELGGRDLVCWCSPKHCHGDVLLEFANNLGLESLFE